MQLSHGAKPYRPSPALQHQARPFRVGVYRRYNQRSCAFGESRMPQPELVWRHVVISTYGSWLPGDPRGWRSKQHRVHSSGDYRHPPPEREHAGLYQHSQQISDEPVIVPKTLRRLLGRALLDHLREAAHEIAAIAMGGQHAHLLAELPIDLKQTKQIVGRCKGRASHAVQQKIPGRLWARDGRFSCAYTHSHHRRVYRYILEHHREGAWTWSIRDGERCPL